MAKKMHPCEPFTIDELPNVGVKFVNSVVLPVTREQVWEIFEDAEAWTIWAWVITKVDWTSPKPFGIGTTRTVTMVGMVGDEEFIEWKPLEQMAFCFTACSMKDTLRFGEDYQLTEIDASNTKVQWTMVMESRSFLGRAFMKAFAPILSWQLGQFLKKLRKYADEKYNK